jgi:hypothetical protein
LNLGRLRRKHQEVSVELQGSCYCIVMFHVGYGVGFLGLRGSVGELGIVADLLFGWWNWLGKHSSDIWNIIPLCLMWTVWWEGNRCTFEDEERSTDELETNFFRGLFY